MLKAKHDTNKSLMNLSRKKFGVVIAVTVLVTCLLTTLTVIAATPTTTFSIYGGNYPGAPSYTVFSDGSGNYFAKDSLGVIRYAGSDGDTVLQSALSALTGTRKQTVKVVGEIQINGNITLPPFSILDIEGKLTATSNIVMVQTNGYETEIYGQLDMNNQASIGLLVQHSLNKGDLIINNVPASGIGLNFLVTDENYGCYWNSYNVWIEGYGTQPTGSYGVLFNSNFPASTDPNMNRVSGRIQNVDVGLKVETGTENLLTFLDISLSNTAFDLDQDTTIINGWEEANDNYGYLVGSGVTVKMVGGYGEKYDFDGDGTGQIISIEDQGLLFKGKVGANTTALYFSVASAGRFKIFSDGTWLFFYDIEHSETILKVNMIGTERGDIHILKAGQGLVLTNLAGTVTKRARLNDTGNGWIFEDP